MCFVLHTQVISVNAVELAMCLELKVRMCLQNQGERRCNLLLIPGEQRERDVQKADGE